MRGVAPSCGAGELWWKTRDQHCPTGGQPLPALRGWAVLSLPCGSLPEPTLFAFMLQAVPREGSPQELVSEGLWPGPIPSQCPISTPSPRMRDTTCFDVIYGPPSIGSALWRERTQWVRQTQAGKATVPSTREVTWAQGTEQHSGEGTNVPLPASPLLQLQPQAESVQIGSHCRGKAEQSLLLALPTSSPIGPVP